MGGFLLDWYFWVKALHIISVISWMAGMFYLPRLFVYHTEKAAVGSEMSETFKVMERKLMRAIINPAMTATWIFGLLMVFTPGVIDWSQIWPWVKAAAVLLMSGFHGWLSARRKEFERDENTRTGRAYRLANEVPTVLMLIIVISVIVKPF
ncbi:MAG TPA: protoporphyrinogen oxidase HemJ [Rhodobacteraceae bacterium]|nr:protoporphyrinogen oxidase HemJ [Paracoccaceae bacterium]